MPGTTGRMALIAACRLTLAVGETEANRAAARDAVLRAAGSARFGSGRFLFVVAVVYLVGGAARAASRSVSFMYAEKERLIANERSRDHACAAADFP